MTNQGITSEGLYALMHLIVRLEHTEPLSRLERFRAEALGAKERGAEMKASMARWKERMLRPSPPPTLPHSTTDRPNTRPMPQDLLELVSIIDAEVGEWFRTATRMNPDYVTQVALVLESCPIPEARLAGGRLSIAFARHLPRFDPTISFDGDDPKRRELQARVPRLRIEYLGKISRDGSSYANFDTTCEECGGTEIYYPDGEAPNGPVVCVACQFVLGKKKAMEDLARHIVATS